LHAWRGTKPDANKEVKFEEKKPGGFFANLGGSSDWNVNCLP